MTSRSPRRALLATCAALSLVATCAATAPAAPSHTPGHRPGHTPGAGHAAGSAHKALNAADLSWTLTPTGHDAARFRGLAPVSRDVAWVSGSLGTVLRTTDGGRTWQDVSPKGMGTEQLQFRDIEATSARHAVIMAAGEAEDSRILVTDDGGATWTEAFRNTDPKAFYDAIAFANPKRGLAMSDPVADGTGFRILQTRDGGHSWSLVDPAGMPPALAKEGGFAASGTCLIAGVGGTYYLVSGGGAARVYVSHDFGETWAVSDSPIAYGDDGAAGIFSVAFQNRREGVLVGGSYTDEKRAVNNAAWTGDGGRTWHVSKQPPSGYRSGSAWLTHVHDAVLAVGPSGSDVSFDAGRTWSTFDTGSFDAVQCTRDGACWASGTKGRVARLSISRK